MALDTGKSARFEVAGVAYDLRFGMSAMSFFEKQTGRNAFKAADAFTLAALEGNEPVVTEVATLLWSAMRPRPASLEEAIDVLDEIGLLSCIGLLKVALSEAFPDAGPLDEPTEPG